MDLNKYYDWESMPLSLIIWIMVKWFLFEDVQMNVSYRSNVESTVWITIKIVKGGKTWYVDGQRNDIVKRRLIELLDEQDIRKDYKKDSENQTTHNDDHS